MQGFFTRLTATVTHESFFLFHFFLEAFSFLGSLAFELLRLRTNKESSKMVR